MRIGLPVKQLNKSKDVLDESVKIVRDEIRDNLNSFMRARNFSRAPGKIGWNFFVCPLHVKACHLSLSLLLIGFSYYFWFVVLCRATREGTRAGNVPCPEWEKEHVEK